MNFTERLDNWQKDTDSLLCVGLDSDLAEIPNSIKKNNGGGAFHSISVFNKKIIHATLPFVCAYKLNLAFYLQEHVEGLTALSNTIGFIREKAPEMPIILDAKMGDINNSSEKYATFAFDRIKVDAATVNPFMGQESLDSFLKREDKGILVLCHTSNPGAKEFQDLRVVDGKNLRIFYEQVAHNVAHLWNRKNNCLLVVGAPFPYEVKRVRRIIGEKMPIFIPGIGAQQGDLEKALDAGLNKNGRGLIINSSRGIIFASKEKDFASVAGKKAKQLRDQINKTRKGL